jgi:Domain of unknown function (DUF4148)
MGVMVVSQALGRAGMDGPVAALPARSPGYSTDLQPSKAIAAIAEWRGHRGGLAWHAARRFERCRHQACRANPTERTTMNHSLKITAMALCVAAVCTGANAQTLKGKTRDEVRQELVGAVRNGGIARGEVDVQATNFGTQAAPTARTRADVLAEFDAARRDGELLAGGESSLKLNELSPSLYARRPEVAMKTRAQVLAELAEAQRTGDIVAAGESGLTLREIQPAAYPRAAMPVYASAAANAPGQRMH